MAEGEFFGDVQDWAQQFGGVVYSVLSLINVGAWNPTLLGVFALGTPLIAFHGIRITIPTILIFFLITFAFMWGLPNRESFSEAGFHKLVLIFFTLVMAFATPLVEALRVLFGQSILATVLLLAGQWIGWLALVKIT